MDINIAILNDKYHNMIDNKSDINYIILSENNSFQIFDIKIMDESIIKIGIIGYVIDKNSKYQLKEIKNEIILIASEFKEKNVDTIILLTNLEARCIGKNVNINMYNNYKQLCDEYSRNNKTIFNVLKNISNIDCVIVSNSYDVHINHWINYTPILSSPSKGKYFNVIYLPFKKHNNKFVLYKNKIKIDDPIPICKKIFNETEIYNNDILTSSWQLINYYWLDKKIYIDNELKKLENELSNL